MDGVFVSVIMNGSSTWVHIRQFTCGDGVMLSASDFASLMFQLKAIEQSFMQHNVQILPVRSTIIEPQVASSSVIQIPIVSKLTQTDKVVEHSSPRAKTKGELRERLKNAPKKRKMTKNNAITMAFATVLRNHIDGMVRSQCLGCTLNLDEHHDLCGDPKVYVEHFFDSAMVVLEDKQVEIVMDEQRKVNPKLPACPPKEIVRADFAWCEKIKQGLLNLC